MAGDIFTPPGFERGMEHEPEVADLLHRLQTLTPQQSRVLGMLAEGLLNKQIAYELGVSEATIKAHVSAILLKLNVDSRTQAVIQLGQDRSCGGLSRARELDECYSAAAFIATESCVSQARIEAGRTGLFCSATPSRSACAHFRRTVGGDQKGGDIGAEMGADGPDRSMPVPCRGGSRR